MAPDTPSSTRCATPIGPSRRSTAGARFSISSTAIWRPRPPASRLSRGGPDMCSYIVEKAALVGSAKGRKGWMRIDTANVYFDHPYPSTLDQVLAIDFTNESEGGRDRVAIELSADSARALVDRILAALASGEAAHNASTPAAL